MLEKLKDRYFILSIFIIAFCGLLVSQLANLQVVNGNYYNIMASKISQINKTVIAPRGGIFDRNNTPIAINTTGYSVQISIADITEDQRNEMILKLVEIFEKNQEDYNKEFEKYITFNPIAFGELTKDNPTGLSKFKKELNIQVYDTAETIFKYLKDTKFKISPIYSDEDAYKIITLRYAIYNKYGVLNPLTICSNVKKETVLEISEKNDQFPGVTIKLEPVRKYNDATSVAHVLGYVGRIDEKSLQSFIDKGYSANDIVGKSGIEKAAETFLKGKDGIKTVTVNSLGKVIEEIKTESVPGNDVVLTVDMNLQKVTENALKAQIEVIRSQKTDNKNMNDCQYGSAVAIDVNTGEVLAMVSYPDYDPSIFLNKDPESQAQRANIQEFNRAVSGEYAPGSAFKALTAVAGLEENAIAPGNSSIFSPRSITEEGHTLKCLGNHGTVDVVRALKVSCNTYFYRVGIRVGITKLNSWADKFGFGKKTGIEIDENAGLLAPPEYKDPKEGRWGNVDTALTAIGQKFTKATPLQIANYVSTIANGGKLYTPHLIKKTLNYDGSVAKITEPTFSNVVMKQSTLDEVKKGMILAAQNSKVGLGLEGISIASKTGTAEMGDEMQGKLQVKSSNAIYICYAPADKPQIAIAIVMERGVWGKNAEPIANQMLKEYFKQNAAG